MKIRNPKSRSDLKIGKNDNVLEVGGGHNPHPRSNVIVDKFIDSSAKHYRLSQDEIKHNAINAPEEFLKIFRTWHKKHFEDRVVTCPNTNAAVKGLDCEKCKSRQGCPAWG